MGQVLTLRSFLRGMPSYDTTTSAASPWKAVPVTVAIVIAAEILSRFSFRRLTGLEIPEFPGAGPGSDMRDIDAATAKVLIQLVFCTQVWTIGLTLLASRARCLTAALRLAMPAGGGRSFAFALALLFLLNLLMTGMTLLGTLAMPDEMARDERFFRTLANSHRGFAALAIGLGAPLSEEFLFRGYLLSSLAATRIGFWPAAILATLTWTGMHWGISWLGLLEVLLLGLYFCWLLRRTGSLWPLLICHSIYNMIQLTWLWFGSSGGV